eukprot:762928-Hanusia_phi.AAC.7
MEAKVTSLRWDAQLALMEVWDYRSKLSSSLSPPSSSGSGLESVAAELPLLCLHSLFAAPQILSVSLINIVLQSLNKDSKVVEWGSGASAIYFSQCVKEWNIVMSDSEHCSNIKRLQKKERRRVVRIHEIDKNAGDDVGEVEERWVKKG